MTAFKFCSGCGNQREEEAKFCHHCGRSFPSEDAGFHRFWLGLSAVVVLTGLVFAFSRFVLLKQPPVAVTDTHEHDSADDPNMVQLREKAHSGEPEALLNLAEYQIQQSPRHRDYLFQAAATLQALLEKEPENAYVLRLLGNTLGQLGDGERAAVYFRDYLKLFPRDAQVRLALGDQLAAAGRHSEAVTQYQSAIEIAPDFYLAHVHLSESYRRWGRPEEAETYKTMAEKLKKDKGERNPAPLALARFGNEVKGSANGDSAYVSLRNFFRDHPIVGPKMTDFQVQDRKATLYVKAFPMEAMPPFVRERFDAKVREQLGRFEQQPSLEIRDADNLEVLARYDQP